VATPAFSEENEGALLPSSSPDEIGSLTSDEDLLIEGVVSPLTGQPCMREIDLVARGAENVVLSRTYISPYIPSSFHQNKKKISIIYINTF
jgi:hypothetical protein